MNSDDGHYHYYEILNIKTICFVPSVHYLQHTWETQRGEERTEHSKY